MISGMSFRKTPACDTSLPLEHYLFGAYLVARARVVDRWFWQSSVTSASVASNDTTCFETTSYDHDTSDSKIISIVTHLATNQNLYSCVVKIPTAWHFCSFCGGDGFPVFIVGIERPYLSQMNPAATNVFAVFEI